MKKYVIDIEANGLRPDTVWCICIHDLETDEGTSWVDTALNDFSKWVEDNKPIELIGHNIIGYDIPVLEKLLKVDFSDCKITDTLVMSRLESPSREGGHSLDNWGALLNYPKGEHDDWTVFSYDMLSYCIRDTKLNVQVYKVLLHKLRGFSSESVDLEPVSYTHLTLPTIYSV